MSRFHDGGRFGHEFEQEFAVRCPKCDHKAVALGDDYGSRAKSAKLVCGNCGYNAVWTRGNYRGPSIGTARDRWFRLPLWFVAESKGHQFWAYNAAHLAFLKNYIGATLRIREPHRNGSLASRLPSFLLDRKNRPAVLKAIAALEKR